MRAFATLLLVALACLGAFTSVRAGSIAPAEQRGRGGPSAVVLATAARMPALRSQPAPDLSALSALPERAEIDFHVVVGVGGGVEHAHVVKPAPSRFVLESALLDAVQRWTFAPATHVSGRPTASLALLRVTIERGAAAEPLPKMNATVLSLPEIVPASFDPATLPATVYRLGAAGVRAPTPIVRVNPDYTNAAMARKIAGQVELDLVVNADGSVGAARVTRPLDADLDRQALIAASYWLFRPASLGGRDVAMLVTLQLELQLR